MRVKGILVIAADPERMRDMVAYLRRRGYTVYRARDIDQASDLLRAGLVPDRMLVDVDPTASMMAELRDAMAARLPGWSIEVHRTDDPEIEVTPAKRDLPN